MLVSKVPATNENPNAPTKDRSSGPSFQTNLPHAKADGPSQSAETKLFASPVLRILSHDTGDTVGFLYEWNNGARQPMWLNGRVRNVDYAPLEEIQQDGSS